MNSILSFLNFNNIMFFTHLPLSNDIWLRQRKDINVTTRSTTNKMLVIQSAKGQNCCVQSDKRIYLMGWYIRFELENLSVAKTAKISVLEIKTTKKIVAFIWVQTSGPFSRFIHCLRINFNDRILTFKQNFTVYSSLF